MKKLFTCILLVLFAMNVSSGERLFGEEEKSNYSYGKIVSVSGNSVTISEAIYNEDTDKETFEEIMYSVAPDAVLENTTSIDSLSPGQEVDIEYVEKEGKKTANYLYAYTVKEE